MTEERETTPRRDMPDEHEDVKEFVEQVDEEVPDEHLEKRVADNPPQQSE